MDRIVHSSAVDIGGGRRGFRSKDTVAGLAGTVVTATHMNATQEEMVALIEKSGLAPNGADLAQLVKAIRSQAMNYRVAGGTGNALSITLDPEPADWAALNGVPLRVRITANNTDAATLAVTGLGGTQPIRNLLGNDLVQGDLITGAVMEFIYVAALGRVVCTNLNKGVGPYTLGRIRSLTATQTWVRSPGCRAILVEGLGGGGAGGGATAAALNELSQGGGGGSGGYFRLFIVGPDASHAATIGAGGTSVSGGTGGNGGTTSWGSLASATGGTGGLVLGSGTGSNASACGSGGVATGGDINASGSSGQRGVRFTGATGYGGNGASSPYGGGGFGVGTDAAGGGAVGYGSGGGGALTVNGGSVRGGGQGANGIIIVWEFY